jgi:hypothetical protein
VEPDHDRRCHTGLKTVEQWRSALVRAADYGSSKQDGLAIVLWLFSASRGGPLKRALLIGEIGVTPAPNP